MKYLIDTNILLALSQKNSPFYQDARNAVSVLRQQGDDLFITPQNLIEFWAVASRPVQNNGLGWATKKIVLAKKKFKRLFHFSPDTSKVFTEWETLVDTHQVIGKQVHDTRLVAVMEVHNLTHILTFNDKDFKRFGNITAVNPTNL